MADLEEKDEILLLDDESTSKAANKEILACLTSLNANMLAVNTSLQQFRSDLHMAEPATKRSISSDKAELSEQEDDQQSDADKLLNQQGSKRRRIADDSTPEGIESVVKVHMQTFQILRTLIDITGRDKTRNRNACGTGMRAEPEYGTGMRNRNWG